MAQSNDSPFRKELIRSKVAFLNESKLKVGNDRTTRFWEDTWVGETPLAVQYPTLYNIVQHKDAYVDTVL